MDLSLPLGLAYGGFLRWSGPETGPDRPNLAGSSNKLT